MTHFAEMPVFFLKI